MSVFFAILLFSFLIFIHELGHFVAAKLSGVQVNEFAMFMGPAIWKKQVGETLYSLRCIPIGGYCAMEGEDGGSDNPRAFHKAAWWKRLIILVAGAAMNFVGGLALLGIVYAPAEAFITPVISVVEENCSLAEGDGLKVGDRMLALDGEKIYLPSDFESLLDIKGGNVHDLLVERNGEEVLLEDVLMEHRQFADGKRFGFSFSVMEATFSTKVSYVMKSTLNNIRLVRLSLGMLLTGQAGVKDMSGPVGIVQMMSETAESSPTKQDALMNMLYFGGFLAINLAVMNLLPVPALDGGRVVGLLVTTAVETVTRKKINPKYEGYLHAAGMLLLLALMAVILFKDIFSLFK